MRKHLKNAFDRLLKARSTELLISDITDEVRNHVTPFLQIYELGKVNYPGDAMLELQLEFAILEATASCSKKALAGAEGAAATAASMYAQITALRTMGLDTIAGEEKFAEQIDDSIMRTEEVHVLRQQVEDCQRKVLALIPQL
jgi:hypothetical protein